MAKDGAKLVTFGQELRVATSTGERLAEVSRRSIEKPREYRYAVTAAVIGLLAIT